MVKAAVFVFCLCVSLTLASRDWEHHEEINKRGNKALDLFWTVDGDEITLKAEAKTMRPAYIAVGWDAEDGKMKNGDMIAGFKENDEWVVKDLFSKSFTRPDTDHEQNIYNAKAGYDSKRKVSWVQFSRKLITEDELQDRPLIPGPMKFSWALGDKPELSHHKVAGHTDVTFLE